MEQIMNKLEKSNANTITIHSMGNTGCVIRMLTFDVSKSEGGNWDDLKDEKITLCSCGNLNHLIK